MATLIGWNNQALNAMLLGRHGAVAVDLARRAVRVESKTKQNIRAWPAIDTGRYLGSITWQLIEDGEGLAAIVGTNVEYAIYVELGTRFMVARPSLEPALEAAR